MSVDKSLQTIIEKLETIDGRLAQVEENMVTKSDLEKAEGRIHEYVDEVAQEIISEVSRHDEIINNRLDDMSLKFVTRDEFDSLKRLAKRISAMN